MINTVSLKLNERRNLLYIFYMIMNQLLMYTEEALGDVHVYVNVAMVSSNYVEPAPTSSKSIIYRQLFDELKSPVF